ncbi:MAG: Riboflavin biosynthesis protein RibF [Anaerolineales bacterium]|nr:Riboflavin biosynthesis protein RibF [Anaerolineales bacterium]
MQHYRSLADVKIANAWLTIGVFDGIHRGHQALLKQLTAGAQRDGAPAVLLSFHPHPANVLSGRDLRLLTTPEERADLAASLGVDAVITEPFTRDLAETSAHDFMSRLKSHLGLSRLLIGYDFALGKNREGNAQRLAELGRAMGYTVEIVPAVSDESGVISSTAIRKLISAGNVTEAAKLLGRNYSLCGPVLHGDGRGRRIGVPTANLGCPESKSLPPNGIYACWARIGAERFMAATNIGVNPTFTPDKRSITVEAHLLDFDRDIYDQTLTIEFVARLRDELKYESVETLVNQIHKDVAETRSALS